MNEGERLRGDNQLIEMQKADVSERVLFIENGSSDWTRTSDIRINSPPFYRLNYRGIV